MESFLKVFFVWFKNKHDKSKFLGLALLFMHFFIKIQPNMSEQEKRQQRIYDLLNTKTMTKNFQNNWNFIMASINLNPPWLSYRGRFRKQTKCNFPSQILVNLRLLLRRNGIKCLKNLIWRHANHFKGMWIQLLKKMVVILSKFTVLCLSSYFDVYFFKLKLILFYYRVICYYTRIFLILFLHPVQEGHVLLSLIFLNKSLWLEVMPRSPDWQVTL